MNEKNSVNNHINLAIDDFIKFSFVFCLTSVLNKLCKVSDFNIEYFKLASGYVTGIVLYDLILS